ncbi:MAG: hypothetical protein PHV68_02295, partial [Candidatus Gastranaerophilales bacterium]|nr:hypothetical protein [Candidatus Gastranaerophilales bacterium]
CKDTTNLKENPAANQALVQKLMYDKDKHYSVMMPYSDKLAFVSEWYAQLWAESLGKAENAKGEKVNLNHTPIKAVGAINQHSELQEWREGANDKVFTIITNKNFDKDVPITKRESSIPKELKYMRRNSMNELINEEAKATMQVLSEQDNKPVIHIEMPKIDAYNLGGLLQMFMLQTAITGELQGLGVNTFLQPAVEDGKNITKEAMQKLSDSK